MMLRNLNLNLVPVLRALLRERSVTRAAKDLGMTQPAVSTALRRLRSHFADPLLLRVGREMKLTGRAAALVEPVEAACRALEEVLITEDFRPGALHRRFTIATADYGALVLIPELERLVRSAAPHVMLRFVDVTPALAQGGHSGEVDFLILPDFAVAKDSSLAAAPLFTDAFVAVVGPSHVRAPTSQSRVVDYGLERCVAFHPNTETVGDARAHMEAVFSEVAHIQVQQFAVPALLALTTSLIAIVPLRVYHQLKPSLPLRIVGGPFPGSTTHLQLAWNRDYDHDPAHRWIGDLILRAAGTAPSMSAEPDPVGT